MKTIFNHTYSSSLCGAIIWVMETWCASVTVNLSQVMKWSLHNESKRMVQETLKMCARFHFGPCCLDFTHWLIRLINWMNEWQSRPLVGRGQEDLVSAIIKINIITEVCLYDMCPGGSCVVLQSPSEREAHVVRCVERRGWSDDVWSRQYSQLGCSRWL